MAVVSKPPAGSVGLDCANDPLDVKLVKELLNANAKAIQLAPPLNPNDPDCGPRTIKAIKDFQVKVVGLNPPSGRVLADGGTIKALLKGAGINTSELAELAAEIAHHETGVEEVPKYSNSGPRVREYLRTAGCTVPTFWCMAFVYWSFQRAAERLKTPNRLIRTTSTSDCYAWAHKHGKLVKDAHRGDIFLLRLEKPYKDKDGYLHTHHHCGIILGGSKTLWSTVEGNTNLGGSDNGYGVFRRKRLPKMLHYVRI